MGTREFNVTAKQATLNESVVTIGDGDQQRQLHPTPQTTALRAQLRKLGAEQGIINAKAAKLAKADDADDRVDEAAELDEQAERVLYQMIAAMLVDGDGKHPDPEWVGDNVSPQVAPELIGFLQGEDEATADPS